MDRNTWNDLSIFQTHDLVRRQYQFAHGRKISAEKAKEITCCFVQGQEYFRNAANAAETVRPLLLYYGVYALTTGAILFLDQAKREATLPQKHGLQQKSWRTTVNRDFLELEVLKTAEGIFGELSEVTLNREFVCMPHTDGGCTATFLRPVLGETSESSFMLGDILSRIPELHDVYCQVTEKKFKVVFGSIIGDGLATFVRFSCDPLIGGVAGYVESESELRSVFQIPNTITVSEGLPDDGFPGKHFIIRLPHEGDNKWSRYCPQIEQRYEIESGKLIAPWPNGGHMSPLLKCFLVSFFLGIAVRYYPSKWELSP